MAFRVFVDGEEGTTGIEIQRRLSRHPLVKQLHIDADRRKDPAARRALLHEADVAFLCLPDAASRDAVALAEGSRVRILDASTAFRTDDAWVYGIPELAPNQRAALRGASRVSVPGCHATGFAMLIVPLLRAGILPKDYPVSCHSVTGYSGGGKGLIADYETRGGLLPMNSPRHYALGLTHKHLPEMQKATGLTSPILFMPIVGKYFSGMVVTVPLHTHLLSRPVGPAEIRAAYAAYYEGERFVRVLPENESSALDKGCLSATDCNGTNNLEIFTFGTGEVVSVMARFDNLGKGASGAAVQCMNVMLGADESLGASIADPLPPSALESGCDS